jgi:hypothetical protein
MQIAELLTAQSICSIMKVKLQVIAANGSFQQTRGSLFIASREICRMANSTHTYTLDKSNELILINING